MSGEDAERMQQLRQLNADLSWVKGRCSSAKQELVKHREDFNKYKEAEALIKSIQGLVNNSISDLVSADNTLSKYAFGNKANMAHSFLREVREMCSAASTDGLGALKTYIQKDKELLNEEYIDAYNRYSNAIDEHDGIVREIWSLGGSASFYPREIYIRCLY